MRLVAELSAELTAGITTQCIVFNDQVSKFAEDVFGNDFCDINALKCVKN